MHIGYSSMPLARQWCVPARDIYRRVWSVRRASHTHRFTRQINRQCGNCRAEHFNIYNLFFLFCLFDMEMHYANICTHTRVLSTQSNYNQQINAKKARYIFKANSATTYIIEYTWIDSRCASPGGLIVDWFSGSIVLSTKLAVCRICRRRRRRARRMARNYARGACHQHQQQQQRSVLHPVSRQEGLLYLVQRK